MAQHELHPVLIAVLPEVIAQPHQMRLVHADVDPPAAEAAGQRGEHGADEAVGVFVVDQKDIAQVPHRLEGLPFERLPQVRQGLDGGHQLEPELRGKVVHAAQLGFGEAAPPVAEIGIAFQLVGVFHVKLKGGIAHFGKADRQAAEGPEGGDGVARAVQQHAELPVGGGLAQAAIAPQGEGVLQKKKAPAEQLRPFQPEHRPALPHRDLEARAPGFHKNVGPGQKAGPLRVVRFQRRLLGGVQTKKHGRSPSLFNFRFV